MISPHPHAERSRWVNRVLWAYALLLAALTALAWGIYSLHRAVATRRPVFDLADRGHDLTNYAGKMAHLDRGPAALATGFPVFNYPAPAAWVYKLFFVVAPAHPYAAYLGLLALGTLVYATITLRAALGREGARSGSRSGVIAAVLATALLGSPMLFTADRGNIEGVVWIFAAAGMILLLRGRWTPAAIAIGVAASIKPFPGLLLLLFLAHRRWRELAVSILTLALVTLAALTALGPNPVAAYRALTPGVQIYLNNYVRHYLPPGETRFDHSLLDGLKSLQLVRETRSLSPNPLEADQMRHFFGPVPDPSLDLLVRLYPAIAAVTLLLLCILFRRKPLLNQLTAAAVVVTLLPLSAGEYTLLYLYVPLGALLVLLAQQAAPNRVHSGPRLQPAPAAALAAVYALLLAPLTLLRVLAGDLKLLLLVLLLVLTALVPLPNPALNPTHEP